MDFRVGEISATSLLSRSMIGVGVPAGAAKIAQDVTLVPKPLSVNVEVCGRRGNRAPELTAIGFSDPLSSDPNIAGMSSKPIATSPRITAVANSADARKLTIGTLNCAVDLKSVAVRN